MRIALAKISAGSSDGGSIEGYFFPPRPGAGRSEANQGFPGDAHHCGDQRSPIAAIERGSGDINFDAPILLAISRKIATVIYRHRRRRRDDLFQLTQQARLVVLDLNDQIVARLAGDLKRFFGSASRRG